MTDTPLKPLPDSASENVPRRMVRPLTTRLLIALVAALIVTGCAFWSGYTTLRGPEGWVGLRRYVPMYIVSIQQDLTKYHEEHEAYPETLREMYEEESAKDNRMLTDEDYNRRITVYRHPVEYERTDSGWQITDFGADGKPGGVGLDADLVITCEMDRDQIFSEARNKKFHATFEQVQTARNDADLGSLFIESLVLGIVAFCCTLRAVNESKENHIV
ncbi:MAG: type II secretion system protein GspG, partial [Planctomycetaceae bacterium]|nr:type II secretion system protein GspG [Planctomycetaceae bacterium]